MPFLSRLFLLIAMIAIPQAVMAADGLYKLRETGEIVTTADGQELRLGAAIADTVARAEISSKSNDNQKFYVMLEKQGPFSAEYSQMALCAAEYCTTFGSGGNRDNKIFTIGAQVSSRAAAEAFAKYLGVTPKLRKHPGHQIAVRFIPSQPSFAMGEPMLVSLAITNEGQKPFTFQVGGQNRGMRDNQFGFTAYDGIAAVPDTGSPQHFGGLSTNKTLRPGETFTQEVDLLKWFSFKKPGTYFMTGTYDLSFFDPGDKNWFVTWQDIAAADFPLIVIDKL